MYSNIRINNPLCVCVSGRGKIRKKPSKLPNFLVLFQELESYLLMSTDINVRLSKSFANGKSNIDFEADSSFCLDYKSQLIN